MTKTDEGRGPQFLREVVVSLAGARFEKFYHHLSGIHIVKQLGGTEFRSPGISGTGEFADEAYAAYLEALRICVADLPEERLRELEMRLSGYAPIGARKVEVQVQVPGTLASEISACAKAMKMGVDTYLNYILDDCLHLDSDDEASIELLFRQLVGDHDAGEGREPSRCTLYLSMPLSGFEGLERLTGRQSLNCLHTVSEIVSSVILSRGLRDRVRAQGDKVARAFQQPAAVARSTLHPC